MTNETLPNAYLDEIGASTYLGLSRRTLQNWRVRGQGPRFAKFGKSVRYQAAELDRWAKAQAAPESSRD